MAIKVNGTSVITDARALNNITSVDATTVAAMGSAGVGGATTQLVAPTTASSVTSLTISLPSTYAEHIVKFSDLKMNDTQSEGFRARFGNSSGTVVSSSVYGWHYISASSTSILREENSNHMRLGSSAGGANHGAGTNATVRIYDAGLPAQSCTYLDFTSFRRSNIYGDVSETGGAGTSIREVNANIRFFLENDVAFSCRYEVWGVNP